MSKDNEIVSTIKSLAGFPLQSVEKKDWTWFFVFADNVSVAAESPWRLIVSERIHVTSEDHEQQFGLPEPVNAGERVISKTSGQLVSDATIDSMTGDLTVRFGNHTQLQFLQLSCGYEAWRVGVRGTEIICIGGGETVYYLSKQPT